MKNYAVLFAPEFRLQATLRYQPGQIDQPVALLEMQGNKPRVVELTAAALAHLVERGMTPTQAMARCPHLHLIYGNAGHERSAQGALLQMAERLSPYFESTGPGIVTVELPANFCSGPTVSHTPDSPDTVIFKKIIAPLQSLGLDIRVGVADTPGLALLAAKQAASVKIVKKAADFLAPLSIATLSPGEEIAGVLDSWGICTIGQFTALPSAQVWERLGPDAVELEERAHGGRARPLKLVKPQEFFAEEAELEHPVEMLEPLLLILRKFLEQITARLGCSYLVAGKLRLGLRFEQGEPYQRLFTIPRPTCDVTLLYRMLHTHLESFTSPSPIIGLELAAKPVRPHAEQFNLLDRGLRDPHQFTETLARLQALLGPDAIGTPELESSHHPDAYHFQPYDTINSPPSGKDDGDPLVGVPWLRFTPPVQAQIVLNENCPAYLYSSHSTGPIRDARGPWHLSGNWWERQCWGREEWDIGTDDGLYRLVLLERSWFLDGIYA